MQLEEIARGVLHVNFETQRELASTFVRIQESFESPHFRGKVFSLEEFAEWYVANSDGASKRKFTYFEDYIGFNVPSFALEPFVEGKFDPLSIPEKNLLDSIAARQGSPFYLIGTFGSSGWLARVISELPLAGRFPFLARSQANALRHELAHALYFLDEQYRAAALQVVEQLPADVRKAFDGFLAPQYHRDVWPDETHAYLMTRLDKFGKVGVDVKRILPLHKSLNEIFDEHYAPLQETATPQTPLR